MIYQVELYLVIWYFSWYWTNIIGFITRISSHERPACKIWLEIGVVIVMIGFFSYLVIFLLSLFSFFGNLLFLWLFFKDYQVEILSIVFFFSAIGVSFVSFMLLMLLVAVYSFFCYYCQVCDLIGGLFYYISYFNRGYNLLNLFKIFITKVQKWHNGNLKVVM